MVPSSCGGKEIPMINKDISFYASRCSHIINITLQKNSVEAHLGKNVVVKLQPTLVRTLVKIPRTVLTILFENGAS